MGTETYALNSYQNTSNSLSNLQPLPPTPKEIEEARVYSFALTGQFEGGKAESLQTKDSGIISYGKHQATLASGSLFQVVDAYQKLTNGNSAAAFNPFKQQIKDKDSSLRNNEDFLNLLKRSAKDPAMEKAQDQVFTKSYWDPAVKEGKKLGLNSVLGFAIFYDTKVQGGFDNILKATKKQFASTNPSESEFLKTFLKERRNYLLEVARNKRAKGDFTTAGYLETAASNRIGKLEALLNQKS